MATMQALAEEWVDSASQAGMHISYERALLAVEQHVAHLATESGEDPGKVAERMSLADLRASVFAAVEDRSEEAPGEDLMDLPRDIPVSVMVVGRAIAAASIATMSLEEAGTPEATWVIGQLAQPLSALGLILSSVRVRDVGNDQAFDVPSAALYRLSWALRRAADVLGSGQHAMADAFRADAGLLRMWADEMTRRHG